MENTNKHSATNLWVGFALGMTASGALIYLLGTKKGRERLKKLIEFAENTNLEEYLENIVEKFDSKVDKTAGLNSGLDNLIDKIQTITSGSNKNKRFLVK